MTSQESSRSASLRGAPLLIHIGLHKTGTTWLQQGIFADESYGFVQAWPRTVVDEAFIGGNPLAFDAEHARSLVQPFVERAEKSGSVPVVSHEPLSGLPALNGYDSKTIADRLHDTYPQARILIVIREQRSMMLSVYKQEVTNSATTTIARMWREYTPAERRRPTPGLDVFAYDRLIAYYQKLFGAENVLVLPYELLVRDDVAFASKIFSFVGLAARTDLPKNRPNAATPGFLIAALRTTNKVLRSFGIASPYGGPIGREEIRGRRIRTIRRLGPKIPAALSRPFDRRMKEAIEAVAAGRFAASNQRTTELTGLDLAAYGYETGRL